MKISTDNISRMAGKFTKNRYVKIITSGFVGVNALTIGGAIFMLIRSIPLGNWYTEFLVSSGLYDLLNFPIMITTNIIALYLVASMGYQTASSFGKNPFSGAIISLGSLLVLTPFTAAVSIVDEAGNTVSGMASNVIPVSSFGANGIFLAMIVGILAARLYAWCLDHGLKIKMPDSVPSNVTNMFETMIPAALIFIIFMAIRFGLAKTSFGTAQNLIYQLLQEPLTKVGGGLAGYSIFMLVTCILWWFGVHGGMVAYAGMAPIYVTMANENLAAYAAGIAAPHPEWSMLCFVTIGGTGALFALQLLMLVAAKSKQTKALGRITLPTSLFSISEPIVFGTPIVLNSYYLIPFIVAPQVNIFLSCLMFKLGLIAPPTGASITTYIPVGLQAVFATNSWSGLLWVIILVAIDAVIYYPFFIAREKTLVEEERNQENE